MHFLHHKAVSPIYSNPTDPRIAGPQASHLLNPTKTSNLKPKGPTGEHQTVIKIKRTKQRRLKLAH